MFFVIFVKPCEIDGAVGHICYKVLDISVSRSGKLLIMILDKGMSADKSSLATNLIILQSGFTFD